MAAQKSKSPWNKDLYGPVLLFEPGTRKIYANHPDSAGVLVKENGFYSGYLPREINAANTNIKWNGTNWAMVVLPLPKDKPGRIALLAHESFHRIQEQLGFKLYNVDNDHLDKKEGRIYLRLELEALRRALASATINEALKHINNALLFRLYRHSIYDNADSLENQLELNEGLAEYTATMMLGNKNDIISYKASSNKQFLQNNKTFVRSFAYETVPVYGYFLSMKNKRWHQMVTANTNLTTLFIKGFKFKYPPNLDRYLASVKSLYSFDIIALEEIRRDTEVQERVKELKLKFIERPHLDLPFVNMNISFNPGTIFPLEDNGSVYSNLRVTDAWGILEVTGEGLISKDWKKITLSLPEEFNGNKINGEGWKLELKVGWKLEKENVSGNYLLQKK